ncbi:MAG: hypothetical protein H6707_20015 [Deltaproteobacteria bacterium]|nr:hypothetical protein [Deltaproteobacteria bacterium]
MLGRERDLFATCLITLFAVAACARDDNPARQDLGARIDGATTSDAVVDAAGGDGSANDSGGSRDAVLVADGVAIDGASGPDGAATDIAIVTDAGAPLTSCGIDLSLKFYYLDPLLQFESADKKTCVVAQRRDDSQPGMIYKAVPFTLLSLTVGHNGVFEKVSAGSKLSWTSTHHNWFDEGVAQGAQLSYTLAFEYKTSVGLVYTLVAKDAQAKVQWGPIDLLPVSQP